MVAAPRGPHPGPGNGPAHDGVARTVSGDFYYPVARAQPHDEYVDPFDVGWRERLVVLGLVYGALVVAFVLGTLFDRSAILELGSLMPISFFVAGKFLPLWALAGKSHFGPYELGAVVWLMDTFFVLNLVYMLEGLNRFEPLRRRLLAVQHNAQLVLRAYPAIRRAAVVGVVVFVLFPVAGTGAIGGTFLGILLGMNRYKLMGAVSLGGLLGGMTMAFATVHFQSAVRSLQALQTRPLTKYLFMGGVVLVLVLAVFWLNRAYRAALAQAEKDSS